MVQAVEAQAGQLTKDGARILNNRYVKKRTIESGSFATVYEALDSLVKQDGQVMEAAGAPRLLAAEHLALL